MGQKRKLVENAGSTTTKKVPVLCVDTCIIIRVARCPEMNRTVRKSKGLSGRKIYPLPDNVVSGNFVIALIFHVKLLKIVIFSGWTGKKWCTFSERKTPPTYSSSCSTYLSIPVSHASVERVFSVMGNFGTDKRNRCRHCTQLADHFLQPAINLHGL